MEESVGRGELIGSMFKKELEGPETIMIGNRDVKSGSPLEKMMTE